jgi:putative phosphoesterase
MRIGLISDVHCNVPALTRALALLDDCAEILCAGDLIYQFRFSNEILAMLRDHKVRTIVGNHDKSILLVPNHPLRASPTVDPAALAYLAGLPTQLSLELPGTRIAMFHGSPWDDDAEPHAYYVYPQNRPDIVRVAEVDADVIVLGHAHVPYAVSVAGKLIVNPGACGEPCPGTGLPSCAALDVATGEVEFRPFALS